MTKNKNILVIVDTNNLGSYRSGNILCKNYVYLEINKHLHENIVNNFYFKKSKNTSIQVAIPELVLEELKNQQGYMFDSDVTKLKSIFEKIKSLPGNELKISDTDYIKYLDNKSSGYIGYYNIKKIDNPPNEILVKLINKSLKKQKPFYKKDSNIDSGFKDAIIWESILEFVKKNKYDKYFFLTDDSDFEDIHLSKEFLEVSGREIIIVKDVSVLKGILEAEIKGTDIINKSLEVINSNLLNILKSLISNLNLEIISRGSLNEGY